MSHSITLLMDDALSWAPALWGVLVLGAKGTAQCMGEGSLGSGSTAWVCRVSTPFGRLQTSFTLGSGHRTRLPNIMEVMQCLASDATFFLDYPTPEHLIASGMIDGHRDVSASGALAKARSLLKACSQAGSKIDRISGPFAGVRDAAEAARVAFTLLESDSSVDSTHSGKPIGVLELAAIGDERDMLAQLLSTRSYSTDRITMAAELAEHDSMDPNCSSSMLRSWIEREDLALSIQRTPGRSSPTKTL